MTSSVPALILPIPDGPALNDPTPDGSPTSPAQLQCDVDPDSALVHFWSTPSPVPLFSGVFISNWSLFHFLELQVSFI